MRIEPIGPKNQGDMDRCNEPFSVFGRLVSRYDGLGTLLKDEGVRWAKSIGLQGLGLETQDVNLAACRFYRKYGFSIGGFDTLVYKNFDLPCNGKNGVYWYLKF